MDPAPARGQTSADDGGRASPNDPGSATTRLKKSAPYILIPGEHGNLLLAWELTSFAMLMYTAFVVPFSLAFQDHNRWDAGLATTYIETGVDILFIVDVVRNFRTAYDDRGHMVSDPWKIARNYARTWLVIDVVASFPLDWFVGLAWDGTGDQGGLLLLLRLCKLWKLLRLQRLWRVGLRGKVDTGTAVGRTVNDLLVAASSTGFWFLLHGCIVFLVLHVDGCIQFFFATLDDAPNGLDAAADWSGSEVAEISWVVRAGLADKPVTTQYSAALVHALLQMLGSRGLVPPQRLAEYWLYFISLMVGAGLFLYLAASLTSRFVRALSDSEGQYRSKLEDIEKWMDFEEFPRELRQRLRVFFKLKHPGYTVFNSGAIRQQLSLPLQQKVSHHICRDLIKTTFSGCQQHELATNLAMALERCVFQENDSLIKQGSAASGVYFLTSGEVEISVEVDGEVKRVPFKGAKFVGEKSLLNRTRAEASVKAVSPVECYLLGESDYNHLVDRFPVLKAWMKQAASVRTLADYTGTLEKYAHLEPPETIRLVSIEVLITKLDRSTLTSYDLLHEHWEKQGSIDNLLPSDAFKEVPFKDLGDEKYGVLTYTWSGMPWKDILCKLKGTGLAFFWIGALPHTASPPRSNVLSLSLCSPQTFFAWTRRCPQTRRCAP